MIKSILIIVTYIVPFLIINSMVYSELDDGDTVEDYNWGMFALSIVPIGNMMVCLLALFMAINEKYGDKIKNIKIK